MSGIYLHIPFCKQACHYCNFHFSTSLGLKEALVDSLKREIFFRKDFLSEKILASIYFGGGTPSLLSEKELAGLLETISRYFSIDASAEITLEANPDDLDPGKLRTFRKIGINRLSVGIQSFFDEDLRWMNRAHSAHESSQAMEAVLYAGFDDISVDLIYGSPTTTDAMWEKNLEKAVSLGVQHISAYCLTVEEKTALHYLVEKKKTLRPDAESALRQFDMLQDILNEKGYTHYEISNFCLPGFEAVHNTSYWKGKSYLGIGPSAHSFDGRIRCWNVSNNKQYIDAITSGVLPLETELLTPADRYNESVMTGLRTIWGVAEKDIMEFGEPFHSYFCREVQEPVEKGLVMCKEQVYTLSREGKKVADGISSRLFYVD